MCKLPITSQELRKIKRSAKRTAARPSLFWFEIGWTYRNRTTSVGFDFRLGVLPRQPLEEIEVTHRLRMEAFIQAERAFLRLSVLVFVFKGQRPVEALSRTQRNAVVTALSSKMSVLAGGPGMGKTSILKTILSILDAEGVKIRLCAPSRNAADRLAEAMGRVAIGVPSLLEFNGANGTFRRNADHPVDCDLILVYESSLLDILFAHRLLAALPSHAAVLFAGDADLPASYGPGNFFWDLIDSQVVPVTKLSVVVQDGPAGWIAKVAHQIRSGEVPQFPSKADDGNCYFLRVDDEEELPEALKDLLLKRLPDAYRIHGK